MSLYPSLEDMKVDQLMKAQAAHEAQPSAYPSAYPAAAVAPPYPAAPPYAVNPTSVAVEAERYMSLYPQLDDYMGLSLQDLHAAAGTPAASAVSVPHNQGVVAVPTSASLMVAPLSSASVGLARAQVTHGIRELLLCKDQKGRVGFRVQAINKGVFVILVQKDTPASLAGLRFGDQVLMINDVVVAGFSMDKVHGLVKKADPQRITMVVRDRPFERTVTVHKDSAGNTGFAFKHGKISSIVKDSSAARNGLLIEHNMLEVNGQNVVSLKDKEVTEIVKAGGRTVTLTLMPSFVFDHLLKNTASSFLKKTMDHSIPEI